MAQVRPRQRQITLGSLIDLSDLDTAVRDLLDMTESQFDEAVLAYIRSDRSGMEAMRDPDVVERTYEALRRLHARLSARYRDVDDENAPAAMRLARLIREVETEHREIRAEAKTQREIRLSDERERAAIRRAKKEAARLEESLAHVRELRAQIEAEQRRSPRARALETLRLAHPQEYLRYVREEQRKDAAAEQAPDGGQAPGVVAVGAATTPGAGHHGKRRADLVGAQAARA